MQDVCKKQDSKLYLYINHDFKTFKNPNPFTSKYHCLKEIKTPVCFAGQKQILFEKKCKINEEIGVDYGYLKQ